MEIDYIAPFAKKKILINGVEKSLFKRVHGVKSANIEPNSTVNIDLVSPYAFSKFNGAEIFGTELGDEVNFTVHDNSTNNVSGLDVATYGANVKLNQFGFNVQMPSGEYKNESDYDADVYQGMIIRCTYTNNSQSTKFVSINIWLHEVV